MDQNPSSSLPPPSRRPMIIGGSIVAVLIAVGGIISGIVLARHAATTQSATSSHSGCPSSAPVPTWPHAATIVLHAQDADRAITAHVNDTIEVDLPAGFRWSLVPYTSTALQLLTPAGYDDPSTTMCVWRFTAMQTGRVAIVFDRQPICVKGSVCSPLIIGYPFGLTIQ
jgi:hypothetical protein